MKILLDEIVNLELVANLCAVGVKRRSSPTPRNLQAWHVTNLLRSAQLIAKGNICYWEGNGVPSGIMSWGRIWESAVDCYLDYYTKQHNGVYVPDIELTGDDITGSLDGIMYLPNLGWVVCETKLRFTLNDEVSLNHLQQMRAYCHLVGVDLVCYVGGYLSSVPPTAKARMRIIRFTEQSIDECWQGIVNTKEYLIKQDFGPTGGNQSVNGTA